MCFANAFYLLERMGPGERVVLSQAGFRRAIRCNQFEIENVPNGMSFAEAASIPCNFITAYYSLINIARLTHGETTLIHSGAGGTGQAAPQLVSPRAESGGLGLRDLGRLVDEHVGEYGGAKSVRIQTMMTRLGRPVMQLFCPFTMFYLHRF